ncbi:hypothetical protein ACW7G0_12855 [Lysobacter sp. A286]
MSRPDGDRRLSERERLEIREALRAQDERTGSRIARIGRILAHPPNEAGDVRRYRFGIAMLGLAIFQVFLVGALPDDDRRWIFLGFAFLTAFVGAWQIDKARPS